MISPGSPHVRPMVRKCGGPGEIELAPIGVDLNGSRRVLHGEGGYGGRRCWVPVVSRASTHERPLNSKAGFACVPSRTPQVNEIKSIVRQLLLAYRFAGDPFFYTTPHHHANNGYADTDGATIALVANGPPPFDAPEAACSTHAGDVTNPETSRSTIHEWRSIRFCLSSAVAEGPHGAYVSVEGW